MTKTLIIGATGGIGSALAKRLSHQGTHQLTLTGRNNTLSTLSKELNANSYQLELNDELELHALMQEVGELDLLIYAAGAIEPDVLNETSSDSWERIFTANLTGAFYALKHARFNQDARVALLGVYPEIVQYPKFAAYAAAKAGLASLADVMRKEWRRKNVHVTLVRLPAVDTPLWNTLGHAPKGAMSADQAAQRILTDLPNANGTLDIIS